MSIMHCRIQYIHTAQWFIVNHVTCQGNSMFAYLNWFELVLQVYTRGLLQVQWM